MTNGPFVRRLEERAAAYLGVRHCVAVASCTAGLMLVLRASELSGDGRALTFRLVQGAAFHDGKPLTAADVKHTFDTVRNPPANVTSVRKSLLSAVSDIVVVDDHTVRFDLSRPSPALLASLATGWFVVGLGRNGVEYSVLIIACLLANAWAHRRHDLVPPGATP